MQLTLSLLVVVTGVVPVYYLMLCIYRLYFHPLSKFPGPKIAAVSQWWWVRHWLGGRWPANVESLHEKYGEVVRTAPDELSFSSASSLQDIYGYTKKSRTPFLKSDFYTSDSIPSISSERDPERHRSMRKDLAPGFSTMALQAQAVKVMDYADMFIKQINEYKDEHEGLNMSEWYSWLAFDILGDLAFGQSFNAVKNAESHSWVKIVLRASFASSTYSTMRRLPTLRIFKGWFIPRELIQQRKRHFSLTREMIQNRLAREKTDTCEDFFSYMLAEGPYQYTSEEALVSQASTLIVAGSETTATLLSGLTYYLLKSPEKLRILQTEIRSNFNDGSSIGGDAVAKLPYLSAVIEEGLRIFQPIPFGLPRISPGAFVDGHYIPAGTTVSSHGYSVARSELNFHNAKSFLPERWLPTSHPLYESLFDNDIRHANKPFSLGPRACLGMNLAYLELRIVLAKMVWTFDWELAEKSIDLNWERDTRTYSLWVKPELRVKFKPISH